jgi:hypothetical protein
MVARAGNPLIVEGHHCRDLELATDRDKIISESPPMLKVNDIRPPEIEEFSDQGFGNRIVGGRPEPHAPRKTDQASDYHATVLPDSDRRLGTVPVRAGHDDAGVSPCDQPLTERLRVEFCTADQFWWVAVDKL